MGHVTPGMNSYRHGHRSEACRTNGSIKGILKSESRTTKCALKSAISFTLPDVRQAPEAATMAYIWHVVRSRCVSYPPAKEPCLYGPVLPVWFGHNSHIAPRRKVMLPCDRRQVGRA
ncbi:unnamed protein product [Protopolystoma xenopodis]|uniref:Uncharacterized protein n=1 Tax=Protopolystoma xenopodis TaxID=117903 RepID=A0A3S4ZBF2_9PLAT|nr:unnamed protein product [Protopolystoma xenopodis]